MVPDMERIGLEGLAGGGVRPLLEQRNKIALQSAADVDAFV